MKNVKIADLCLSIRAKAGEPDQDVEYALDQATNAKTSAEAGEWLVRAMYLAAWAAQLDHEAEIRNRIIDGRIGSLKQAA